MASNIEFEEPKSAEALDQDFQDRRAAAEQDGPYPGEKDSNGNVFAGHAEQGSTGFYSSQGLGYATNPYQMADTRGAEIAFDDAFAAAQGEFLSIIRDREVTVQMKSGGTYKYMYAELSTILAATRPALAKHGISFKQKLIPSRDGDMVRTLLKHKGFADISEYPVFSKEIADPKDLGGQVTYAKRLGAQLALGVASEQDLDAPDANGDTVTDFTGTRPAAQPQATPAGNAKPKYQPGKNAAPAGKPAEDVKAPPKKAARSIDELRKTYSEKELVDMEGKIVDARDELLQAANEGRRVGIEQIWAEIRSNEYVATVVWKQLKDNHADLFATIKEVLKIDSAVQRTPENAR